MRELHVVAVSEDGRHVVLAASKGAAKGTHRVRLDARLIAAVRGELGADHAHDLSPKEIQARLRAGESAEQIAAAAGMALSRVERFAGPVAGERARVIDQAREAFVVRGRLGRSAAPLGVAVDAALADARPETVVWTTRREDDGRWRVQVAWTGRGRAKTAAWSFEPHVRSLEAADPTSAALGHVDANPAPPRRTARRTAPEPPRATASAPAARKAAAKPAAKRVAAKKLASRPTAQKPVSTKPAAKRVGVVSTATRKAVPEPAARRALASKLPATSAVKAGAATAGAAKPARAKPAAAKAQPAKTTAANKPAATKAPRHRLRVVPDPPSAPPAPQPAPQPARRSSADEREGVRARASVPGWADVLLGTTPSGEK